MINEILNDKYAYIYEGTLKEGKRWTLKMWIAKNYKEDVYLVINKIDLLDDKSKLPDIIISYMQQFDFKEVFPISAKTGDGVLELVNTIKALLPLGPKYYPEY